MKHFTNNFVFILALVGFGWLGNGQIGFSPTEFLVTTAEARLGRPATPVSYAGVARRSTVRVATPGVGAGGVGGPASGVGVRPGAGAGRAGVGANRGGPVNRVGVR